MGIFFKKKSRELSISDIKALERDPKNAKNIYIPIGNGKFRIGTKEEEIELMNQALREMRFGPTDQRASFMEGIRVDNIQQSVPNYNPYDSFDPDKYYER